VVNLMLQLGATSKKKMGFGRLRESSNY